MVRRNQLLPVRDFRDRHTGQGSVLKRNHPVEFTGHQHLHRLVAKLGREDPVVGRRFSAALNVPQNGRPTLQLRPLGDLPAKYFTDPTESDRVRRLVYDSIHDHFAAERGRPL